MEWQMIVLAIIQGLTEWLPVSSSGHLAIAQHFLNYEPGLAFDIVLHFGTLIAVFVYFGKDVTNIVEDILKGKWGGENAKLGFLVAVATIPAGIAGYFLYDFVEASFTSLGVIAGGFAITGVVLFIASIEMPSKRKFGYGKAFLVGCAQAVAIFPGISRSGSTIASSLIAGLNEKQALRFSFLMSIPIIFGANVFALGTQPLPTDYLVPCLVSFVVGLVTIHLMFGYLLTSKRNLRWFGIYALLLAFGLGIWLVLK